MLSSAQHCALSKCIETRAKIKRCVEHYQEAASTEEKQEERDRDVYGTVTRFEGTVSITGDLRVDGVVYGQLCSKPRCAE